MYGPFLCVSRPLFLHHYLPSLVFSSLLATVGLHHVGVVMLGMPRLATASSLLLGICMAASFVFFAPFRCSSFHHCTKYLLLSYSDIKIKHHKP